MHPPMWAPETADEARHVPMAIVIDLRLPGRPPPIRSCLGVAAPQHWIPARLFRDRTAAARCETSDEPGAVALGCAISLCAPISPRSDERLVWKESVRTGRARGLTDHEKKKTCT